MWIRNYSPRQNLHVFLFVLDFCLRVNKNKNNLKLILQKATSWLISSGKRKTKLVSSNLVRKPDCFVIIRHTIKLQHVNKRKIQRFIAVSACLQAGGNRLHTLKEHANSNSDLDLIDQDSDQGCSGEVRV